MAMRKGMWVMTDRGIGILNRLGPATHDERDVPLAIPLVAGEAEAHLIAKDGTTGMILPRVLLTDLRQAHIEEIPAARVGHMTDEAWALRGYVHEPGHGQSGEKSGKKGAR